MTDPTAEHNARARGRALEVGALASPVIADGAALVPSGTRPGHQYRVALRLVAGDVVASCTCQAGRASHPAGWVPCWHAARVAVTTEALGLLVWNHREGRWVAGPKAPASEAPRTGSSCEGKTTEAEARYHRAAGRKAPLPGTPEYARMVSAIVD